MTVTPLSFTFLVAAFVGTSPARAAEDDEIEVPSVPQPPRPLPRLSAAADVGLGWMMDETVIDYGHVGLDVQWWFLWWASLGVHAGWFGLYRTELGHDSAYGVAPTLGARLPLNEANHPIRVCLVLDVEYGLGYGYHRVTTFGPSDIVGEPWRTTSTSETYAGRAGYFASAWGVVVSFGHMQIGHVWRIDHIGHNTMISANFVVGMGL
jgi:hypothetical protein